MKSALSLVALLALGLASCGAPARAQPPAGTLTVFAAASLTGALEQIGQQFEAQHPGLHIRFNFAGSQALRTQIEQGAPADVFASASTDDMDALVAGGHVEASAVHGLVTNRLDLILPASNPAGLTNLQDLARPGLKLVMAAPDVPVGKYARQALEKMQAEFGAGFSSRVLANVVSQEDNVKQVVAKVQLGEADAGIVYVSDAIAARELKTIEIPARFNVTASYVIAPLRSAADRTLAAGFADFTRSAAAQQLLARWGFGPLP